MHEKRRGCRLGSDHRMNAQKKSSVVKNAQLRFESGSMIDTAVHVANLEKCDEDRKKAEIPRQSRAKSAKKKTSKAGHL